MSDFSNLYLFKWFFGECNQAIIEIFINLKTKNANDEKVTVLYINEAMLDLIWQSWGEND